MCLYNYYLPSLSRVFIKSNRKLFDQIQNRAAGWGAPLWSTPTKSADTGLVTPQRGTIGGCRTQIWWVPVEMLLPLRGPRTWVNHVPLSADEFTSAHPSSLLETLVCQSMDLRNQCSDSWRQIGRASCRERV